MHAQVPVWDSIHACTGTGVGLNPQMKVVALSLLEYTPDESITNKLSLGPCGQLNTNTIRFLGLTGYGVLMIGLVWSLHPIPAMLAMAAA